MSNIFLSTQAYSSFISLPAEERLLLSKALFKLKHNSQLGIKLWGNNDLYLYQTITETKIIYRLSGGQMQVLAIKENPQLPTASKDHISAVILAAGKNSDSQPLSNIAYSLLNAGIDDIVVVLGYHKHH